MGVLAILFLLIGLGAEPEPRLTDVTAASGIRWKHGGGSTGKPNIREQTGSGVALLDYDRDGWLDIYLLTGPAANPSQSPGNRLYSWSPQRGSGDFPVAGTGVFQATGLHGCYAIPRVESESVEGDSVPLLPLSAPERRRSNRRQDAAAPGRQDAAAPRRQDAAAPGA